MKTSCGIRTVRRRSWEPCSTRNGRKAVDVEPLHRRFAKVVRERCGVVMLSRAERQAVRQEIAALPMTLEANALLRMVLAELSFCCKYGQKRSSEVCDEGCHYTNYLCYEVRNCASNRLQVPCIAMPRRSPGG